MTQLIITLPPEAPQVATQLDYLLSPDGRTLGSQSRASLALLPQNANAEVIVVLPVHSMSWHQIQLPRGLLGKNFLSEGHAPRLRAALEGLLEEQVLDDPAHLHFALAPGARDDAPVWVAACDRAWLRAWLQALEASGHAVSRIVPEFSHWEGTPSGEAAGDAQLANALHVIGTPERAHIVYSNAAGAGALVVLPLSSSAAALAKWPEVAEIIAEPAVAALAEGFFNRRVNLQQSAQRWLLASQSAWDLAQFDLQNNRRSRSWKRVSSFFGALLRSPRWRAARWAAVSLVFANLLGLNAWAWVERQSLDAQRQAVRDVLTTTFPGVKVVVDAPVQMARELALLRQDAGGASVADFDNLLASTGVFGFGQVPTAVDYANQELRLKGLGLSTGQVAQANEKLKRLGLQNMADGDLLTIKALGAP